MKVSVITATENPMDVIAMAAGTCYGKADASHKRVRRCYDSGHMSVFEHASATFKAEGVSRACTHQLVRHRLASFSQLSQRYCKVDAESDDWFVMPPSFTQFGMEDNDGFTVDADWYRESMLDQGTAYLKAIEAGIRPEDARYLLPEATKTAITVTMNARELFHFLDLRQDKAAQWEIRGLADEVERVLSERGQWGELLGLRR